MQATPTAEEMYLKVQGRRALFQGDIYKDVPFTKFSAGDTTAADPKWSAKRRHVATILYPCDMVVADNVTPVKAQPIVQVYDAGKTGLAVSEDLGLVPVGVCPLPDLEGDGRMWVADFRTINVIDRSYLTPNRRVRCLSECGWTLFRQRLGTAGTRAEVSFGVLMELGTAAWVESEMEARWVESGGDSADFHFWLDEPRDDVSYDSLRRALEEGALDLVREELEGELS